MSNIPDSTSKKISGIPDLDSLAWREPWASGKSVYCLFPLKDRGHTREYSQIISTSRWVKKVELYTSMLTCISQDGNDLIILETEDSTIQPALLALLVLRSEQQMPLRAYCEERFRITVILGPGSALGEKGKRRGQIGKNISERSKPRAIFFFFFANADFFPFSPQCGSWSQARLQSNRENREHQKYFWNVIVLWEKTQSGVRKLNGKQER